MNRPLAKRRWGPTRRQKRGYCSASTEAPAHPHSSNTDRRRGGMVWNDTWGTPAARPNHAMVEPRSAPGAAVVS